MKLEKLFEVEAALLRYERLSEAKLGFCFARNLTIVKRETDAFRKVTQATSAMQEFEKEKEGLLDKYSRRDDKNRPVRRPVVGRPGAWEYDIEDQEAYEKALKKLQKDHAQALEDEKELLEKRKELLDEDLEVKFRVFQAKNMRVNEDGQMAVSMRDLSIFLDAGIIVGDPFEDDEEDDKEDEKVTPLPKKRRGKQD